MRNPSLIYSDKPVYRICRHLLFWATRFLLTILFNFCLYLTARILSPELSTKGAWLISYKIGLIRILIDVVYSYSIVYILLPAFLLTKNYWRFITRLLLLTVGGFIADAFLVTSTYGLFGQLTPKMYEALWYEASSFINSGPHVVCVFFVAAKMLKDWYLEQSKKLEIVKASANAELQLLKAQMHPHFLFNTLNNIYSFTLTNDPAAATMVTKLSGLMDYMNSEGEKDRVLIEKEIQLIKDYIDLEKVRYGERLDIRVDVTGNFENKSIAPLLMITFVENSFKHGAGIYRGNQWLKLHINIKGNHLCFDLSNSKSSHRPPENGKKGIGLLNVRKRLQLMYPGKHILQVISTDSAYAVHLEIELGEEPISYIGQEKSRQHQLVNYV